MSPVAEVSGMEQPPLTARDRCDRCGGQAYVRTQHEAGELLWCAHHSRVHKIKLAPNLVLDESTKLTEKPEVTT